MTARFKQIEEDDLAAKVFPEEANVLSCYLCPGHFSSKISPREEAPFLLGQRATGARLG